MHVGDLVEFSAYGRARKYNLEVILRNDVVGVITEVHGTYEHSYRVVWVKSNISFWPYRRKELKYAKTRDYA